MIVDADIVITGAGAVTPLGHTLAATRAAICRREVAFAPATLFDASGFRESRAAEVRGFDAREHFRFPKAIKLTDRRTRFAVAAAAMALTDARWSGSSADHEQLAVVVGTSASDMQAGDLARALVSSGGENFVADTRAFAGRVLDRLNPLWLLVNLPNMASAHVAIQLEARGPNSTIMSDWAAGVQSIGEAADWIRAGECSAVIAGGADSGIHPFAYGGYEQAGLFDRAHDGEPALGAPPSIRTLVAPASLPAAFVPGEGAAMLFMESASRARQRGATVIARVVGSATRAGAPEPTMAAAERVIEDVIVEAGWGDGRPITLAGSLLPAPAQERDGLALRCGADVRRLDLRCQLGHSMACSGVIDLLVAIASADTERLLCVGAGHSGHVAVVAVERCPTHAARGAAS